LVAIQILRDLQVSFLLGNALAKNDERRRAILALRPGANSDKRLTGAPLIVN
jgi:hypothetical protein